MRSAPKGNIRNKVKKGKKEEKKKDGEGKLGFVSCPKCSVNVRTDHLDRHMKRAHSPGSLSVVPFAKVVPPAKRAYSVAGFNGVPLARRASSAAHVGRSLGRMVRCPSCGRSVRGAHLEKHLRTVHRHGRVGSPITDGSSTQNKGRSMGTGGVGKLPLADNAIHSLRESVDRRDAHRLMGYLARENGRYGSHPLHDRFDDESSA
jgi:hypothetical protein